MKPIAVFCVITMLLPSVVFAQTSSDLATAFGTLESYTGGSNNALKKIMGYVDAATKDYEKRRAIEPRLVSILQSRSTHREAKNFAAEQLYRICDEDTIPDFSKLLNRSDTTEFARRGLELIDHSKAQTALLEAFADTKGSIQMGIAESLGVRSDPSAVRPLQQLAIDGNEEQTVVALDALAKIGGSKAGIALNYCRDNLKLRRMRNHARDAYLRCGWTSLKKEDYLSAIDIFDSLTVALQPMEVRTEALRGLIRAQREDAVALIVKVLSGDEPELHTVAASEAPKVLGSKATDAFVKAFPDLTTDNQIIVLDAFAQRGDKGALQTVIQAAGNRYGAVRMAGLRALGAFNHPDSLQPLLKASIVGTPEEQEVARANLVKLEHPDINGELVRAAMSADNAIRGEAIRTMVTRRANNGVPVLLRIAQRDVPELRVEAMRGLGVLGSVDALPDMIAVHNEAWDLEIRKDMSDAILNVAWRAGPDSDRIAPLAEAITAASSLDEARISLIYILSKLADAGAIPALSKAAEQEPRSVQDAAYRVLARWEGNAPALELERLLKTAKTAYHRKTGLDGLIRMFGETEWPNSQAQFDAFQRLSKLANSPAERRKVIAAVRAAAQPALVEALADYDKDAELVGEMQALRRELGAPQV